MKKIYFIRHQELTGFPQPHHTPEALEKIRQIELPLGITKVICGTGRPFVEILRIIQDKLSGARVKFSPFCGEHNFNKDKKYVLADGTEVDTQDYIGIKSVNVHNAWGFVTEVSENFDPKDGDTLFIGGGEMGNALDLNASCGKKKHLLYELFAESKEGRVLQ